MADAPVPTKAEQTKELSARNETSKILSDHVNDLLGTPMNGSVNERSSHAEATKSDGDWRPLRAREERAKLTDADKKVFDQLENAFINGDLKGLAQMVEKVNPNKDGNNAAKQNFEHAFNAFQLETGALGFEAIYDRKSGVLHIDNTDGKSSLRSLQIDPQRNLAFSTTFDQRNATRHEAVLDMQSGKATERRTNIIQPDKIETSEIPPDKVENDFRILKDQIAVRKDNIEHEQIDRRDAAKKEQRERDEQFQRERESGENLRKQDRELEDAMGLPRFTITR